MRKSKRKRRKLGITVKRLLSCILTFAVMTTTIPIIPFNAAAETVHETDNQAFGVIAYDTSARIDIPYIVDATNYKVYISSQKNDNLDALNNDTTKKAVLNSDEYKTTAYVCNDDTDAITSNTIHISSETTYYLYLVTNDNTLQSTVMETTKTVDSCLWTSEGNYDTSWYNTTDTEFAINSAEQLAGFAVLNNGMNGVTAVDFISKTIHLTNSIDLSAYRWIPIGTKDIPFNGVFDGGVYENDKYVQSNVVKGLHVNGGYTQYQGLFGYAANLIHNIGIVDSFVQSKTNNTGGVVGYTTGDVQNCFNTGVVKGSYSVGGVIGCSKGTTISNCYNTGDINGVSYFAGIVGGNSEQSTSISNCYNTGTVSGYNGAGGIAGYIYGQVNNCYNMGTITVKSDVAAGIVACNNSAGKIYDCYNIGAIAGPKTVGGITGLNYASALISNCYNLGTVTGIGTDAQAIGGISGNHYRSTMENSYNIGTVSAESGVSFIGSITGMLGDTGEPSSLEKITNCTYLSGTAQNGYVIKNSDGSITGNTDDVSDNAADILAKITADGTDKWTASPTQYAEGGMFSTSNPVNQGYPVQKSFGYTGDDTIMNSEFLKDTDGTTNLIKNAYQFDLIKYDDHASYKFTTNIDISPAQYNKSKNLEFDWKGLRYLYGTLDGNGYSVSGFYANNKNFNDINFVNYNYGIIKNLGVTDGFLFGESGVSGLVGSNNEIVKNCYFTGFAGALNNHSGGVVTSNYDTISKCYNAGSIFGGNTYTGGISAVSTSKTSTITCSYNIGTVNGSSCAAGIVGCANASITNSYNTGNITGRTKVSGICAMFDDNTIANCYNTGNMNGRLYIGGICGSAGGDTDLITNCYNTGDMNAPNRYYVGGIVGALSTGTVSNCYSTGFIRASRLQGGIAGENDGGTIRNAYYSGADFGVQDGLYEEGTTPFVKLDRKTVALGNSASIIDQTDMSSLGNSLGADFGVSYPSYQSANMDAASVTDHTVVGKSSGFVNINGCLIITQNELDMVNGTGFTGAPKTILAPVSMPLTVLKGTPTLNLSAESSSFDVGEAITLTASISNGYHASGTVTFYNYNTIIGTKAVSDCSASIEYPLTSPGNLMLKAEYSGDVSNTADSDSKSFTVYKKQPRLIFETNPHSQTDYSNDVVLTATLENSYGNVAGQHIIFGIDGIPYTAAMNESGVATYTLTPNAGNYTVCAEYEGDTNNKSTATGDYYFSVNKGNQTTPTISVNSATTVTYGYNDPYYKATASGSESTGEYVYRSSDDSVVSVDSATGALTVMNAGTATIYSKHLGDDNYNDSAEGSVTITVLKKKLNVTITPNSKTYDGTTQAEIDSIYIRENVSDVSVGGGQIKFVDKNVGENKPLTASGFCLNGLNVQNYEIESLIVESTDIRPANLVVTNTSIKNKIYDGTVTAEFIGTPELIGVVNGDDVTLINGIPTFVSKDAATSTVHLSAFTLSGNDAKNYRLSQPISEMAYISKKRLRISADPVTIKKGQKIPPLIFHVTGFVDGESETNLSGYEQPNVGASYFDTLKLVTNAPLPIYSKGGNATNNYMFSCANSTQITVQPVFINNGDYKVTGNYSVTQNPTNWNTNFLRIIPTNGYDWISADGTSWQTSFDVQNETANGKMSFILEKSSDGTQTEYTNIYYNLDKTAPTGTINICNDKFNFFLNTITFGLFFKDTVDVTITGKDTLSGVKSVEYQKVANEAAYDENGTWTSGNEISVSPDEAFIVYARITDNAGNVTIINSNGIVVYTDSILTTTTATFDNDTSKPGYEDIPVTMNLNNNTLKAITNGDYTLVKDTDYIISDNTITLKKEYLKTVVDGTITLTFTFNPMGEEFVDGDKPSEGTLTITQIIHAQKPEFTKKLSGQSTYTKGDTPTPLTVKANITDKGNVTYQWFICNENKANGTAIDGATTDALVPSTDKTGVFYYYVVATNTNDTVNGDKTCVSTSGIYKVTINHLEVLDPEVTDDTPHTSLKDKPDAIEEAVLSDIDKEKLSKGSDISIYLKVEKTDDPDTADKNVLSLALDGKSLGEYLDMSLIKNIDGTEQKVAQTNNPLRITIDIPVNLRASKRTFSIVRVHDGEAQTLMDLDNDPNTITIETDRFSTYAIVYQDTTSDSTQDTDNTPKTGDTYPVIPVTLMGLGLLVITLCRINKQRLIRNTKK